MRYLFDSEVKSNVKNREAAAAEAAEAAAAASQPQIQIVDGKVVINEESLIQTAPLVFRRQRNTETTEKLSQRSFRRKETRFQRWNKEQTAEFYRALRVFGPNLTNMTLILKDRTRDQLRSKMHSEEKRNPHLVDFAVRNRIRICESDADVDLLLSLRFFGSGR